MHQEAIFWSDRGSNSTTAAWAVSCLTSFLRLSGASSSRNRRQQVSGTRASQPPINSASAASSRALPARSSPQSFTTTRRLSHIMGSVSAASMTAWAVKAPSNTFWFSASNPEGSSRTRRASTALSRTKRSVP